MPLFLPPEPNQGEAVSASAFATLVRYVRSITPRSSSTCRVQLGAGGVTLHPKLPRVPPAPPAGGGAPPANFPFEIFCKQHLSAGVWDGTYDVTLYPGTVTQLLPSNIFATINEGITSVQYVVLTAASSGYAVTGTTWSLTGSPPAPLSATADTPPASFTVIVGIIAYTPPAVSGQPGMIKIFQLVTDNLQALPVEWTRSSRAGAGPYELAYQVFYAWNIQ